MSARSNSAESGNAAAILPDGGSAHRQIHGAASRVHRKPTASVLLEREERPTNQREQDTRLAAREDESVDGEVDGLADFGDRDQHAAIHASVRELARACSDYRARAVRITRRERGVPTAEQRQRCWRIEQDVLAILAARYVDHIA
jgi:hypothetical protein